MTQSTYIAIFVLATSNVPCSVKTFHFQQVPKQLAAEDRSNVPSRDTIVKSDNNKI